MNLEYPVDKKLIKFNKIHIHKGKSKYYLIGEDSITNSFSLIVINIVRNKSRLTTPLNQILQEINISHINNLNDIMKLINK